MVNKSVVPLNVNIGGGILNRAIINLIDSLMFNSMIVFLDEDFGFPRRDYYRIKQRHQVLKFKLLVISLGIIGWILNP